MKSLISGRNLLALGATALLPAIALRGQEPSRPNIVFIMADDHAAKAISCYGSGLNQTPNIDRIAENGVRFTNCFCTNAISGPSRASILSGQLSHQHGFINNASHCDSSMQTLPLLLDASGYQTALFGKWHLNCDPAGFDTWKILPGQGEYYNPDFIENGLKQRHEGYVTDLITQFTLDWLNQCDTTRPFAVMVHHKAPHRNWQARPDLITLYDTASLPLPGNFNDGYSKRPAARQQKMSVALDLERGEDLKFPPVTDGRTTTGYNRLSNEDRHRIDSLFLVRNAGAPAAERDYQKWQEWKYRRYLADYLATVYSVDQEVGEVLDWLKQHHLEENTIVVYVSDQGMFLGEHGWFDKRFMYEESLRMPLLISWPGQIKPGTVNDQLLMNIDLAPTLLDMAGIQAPASGQGKSFQDFIDTTERLRDAVWYHYFEYPGPHSVKRHYGIRTDRYKLIHFYHDIDHWELYDLEKDPGEMKNVYGDPEYWDVIGMMHHKLKALQEQYGDTNMTVPPCIQKVPNLALNSSYKLRYSYSLRYRGDTENPLTNGNIEHPDCDANTLSPAWNGFRGVPLDIAIKLGKKTRASTVELRFLHLPESWIFAPDTVQVFSGSGKSQEVLQPEPDIRHEPRKGGGEVVIYSFTFRARELKTISVRAVNRGTCPPDHPGAGQPAWLFCDEVIVR